LGDRAGGFQKVSGPGIAGLPNGSTLAPLSGSNVMPLTVNGSLCSAANSAGYINKPCVSVTICDPTGAQCATVDDILVDTGSYGLRVFGSVLARQNANLPGALTPIRSGAAQVAECVAFADGSAVWGPVELAGVTLGGEPAVQVPVQVIDAGFAPGNSACVGAESGPVQAGYNGILGVGLFAQDCGLACSAPGNGMYFKCSGSSCSGYGARLAEQVTNPVAALPQDNNGVILELPSLDQGGVGSVSGYLVLGIGTQANNIPSGVAVVPVDSYGEFSTTFGGRTYPASFLDSGSNALYFSPPTQYASSLPGCGAGGTGFLCPPSATVFTAVNSASDGSAAGSVPFMVGNASLLFQSTSNVFMEVAGGDIAGSQAFDWGLPFHLGRNVYVGIEGRVSSLGTGPDWAY
jgi:hypothetical protein